MLISPRTVPFDAGNPIHAALGDVEMNPHFPVGKEKGMCALCGEVANIVGSLRCRFDNLVHEGHYFCQAHADLLNPARARNEDRDAVVDWKERMRASPVAA